MTKQKQEYNVRPISEIVKRYERTVRESSKYEVNKDADLKKLNHIIHIQKELLGWVLCQDL